MRAVDYIKNMVFFRGGSSPAPSGGTVIFDGNGDWQYYEEQSSWAAFITPTHEPLRYGMATLVLDGIKATAYPQPGGFDFRGSNEETFALFSSIGEGQWVLATGPYQPTNPHITITQEEGEVPTFYQGSVVCDQYREGTGYYGLFTCEVELYTDMTIFGKINGVDVSGVVYAGICQFEEGLEIRSTGGAIFELFIPESAPATYSLDLKYY